MDPALILELSSDEEVGLDNSSTTDYFDWVTKLFEDVGGVDDKPIINSAVLNTTNGNGNGAVADDDDDDVVVVGEVIVQKPKKAKTLVPNHDDDDDCVVLDGDPNKPKDDVKDSVEDSDELLIVGEKGQVACRDYPHARHSCAKFPFSSTPHESRCDLCHCYVCDSLAPCSFWGSGVSSIDHCHATDKEEYWKLERKRVRQLQSPQPPTPITTPDTGFLPQVPQSHQVFTGPNQLLRPISTGGMSSTLGVPNITRSRRPSVAVRANRFQPHLVAGQLSSTRNAQAQFNRDGRLISRNRMVPSRPVFKRVGITRRPFSYQPTCHSPNNGSVAYLRMPNEHFTRQSAENMSTNLRVSSRPPITSSMSPVRLPLQLQRYNHPSSHTTASNFHGYGHSAAVTSNSPYMFTSMNQAQNVPSLLRPCNTSAENSNLPRSEQQSDIAHNISGPTPNVHGSINQRSHLTSAEHSYCSPLLSCSTPNAPNSVAQSCEQSAENSLVGGGVPVHELLTSLQQDAPPSGSAVQLEFEFEQWLQDNESILGSHEETFLFDTNNQASMSEPVDAGMLYFDFETSWKGLTQT